MPRGDVGERELAALRREHGVEEDLEQQVAELLLEVLVRRRSIAGSSASIASSTS